MLRFAFTLLELIIVLVVMGILAVVAYPRLEKNNLIEARDQVINHMRYTQHLAMTHEFYLGSYALSDKTNLFEQQKESSHWFKRWWQIQFHTGTASLPYSIYSDHATNSNATPQYGDDPDATDIYARDFQTGFLLVKSGSGHDDERLTDVDLATKYDIESVSVVCPNNNTPNLLTGHIKFDSLGRPHCTKGAESSFTNSYNPFNKIVNGTVKVTLNANGESVSICVEAESGYIHEC